MILRIWRAALDPAHREAYRRFERERCLPMLRKQAGFLGGLFGQGEGDRAASLTLWEDRGAVEALESSPSYRQTELELAEGHLLLGEPSVEIAEVVGGDLRSEALLGALERTRRASLSGSSEASSREE